MYEELIKRLREKAGAFDYDGRPDIACDYEQAADAIEELIRENKEIMFRANQLEAMNDALIGETGATDALIVASKPRWISVEERLPEEPGMYIVFLRCGAELQDPGFPEDLSYVTAMHFDFDQRIWNDGVESYNANLDVVNKPHAYYVTHWMPLPSTEGLNET